MKTYKYTDETQTIVHVIDDDGVSRLSMLVSSLPLDEFGNLPEILPHDEPSIEELKVLKTNEIKKYRDNLTQLGGYKAQGKWFHSDTFSRSQQIGLVLLGANIPVGTTWKTMDGSFIEMNQQLANEVFISAAIQDATLFAHAEVLIQQVLNLQTLQEVKDFDITQGWPETFLTL